MMKKILINTYLYFNKILSFFGIKLEYIGIRKYKRLQDLGFNVIIDVGASRGQSIDLWSWILGNDIMIFSFEPIKEDFMILQKKYGNHSNIKLFNMGLGSKKQDVQINLGNDHDSSSILKATNIQTNTYDQTFTQIELIHIDTLDGIMGSTIENKKILMKIDVQGFELEVLKGGRNLLNHVKMVIVESSYDELYEDQPLFDEVYMFMKNLGFQYIGSHYQSISPKNGKPMQQDAIFIKH